VAATLVSAEVTLGVDLHARPAGKLVKTALGFRSRTVVTAGERSADARSLIAILALGARAGTTVQISAEGEDASAAISALTGCLAALVE
jgi:phosphotransferase system HPr (HPr) family protein